MKLYTIKAKFEDKVYMLVSSYDARDHFLERDLSFEENGSPYSYDRPFFSHDKEAMEKLIKHLQDRNKDNYEIDLHDFENHYSYFETFELIEVDI